jgi:hypothetical protein
MLQQYVPNVLSVSVLYCNKCFHIVSCKYFDLEVAYVAMPIHVYFKCMFQMFQLFQKYAASVLSGCCICCRGYTHMLQEYVPNISPVLDICCRKCFHVASVFINRHEK